MTNFVQKYQSIIGQVNYTLFLVVVALLPFPQLFLRHAFVLWAFTWMLEGRFCKKPIAQDWRKMMPFILFGIWYLWKIISGLWADNMSDYTWQLNRYLSFGLLVPVGIWGLNQYYDWKQVCRVLVISCLAAIVLYTFTLFWVQNARAFDYTLGDITIRPLSSDFFAEKISHIKHRLFLCSVELMGVMALLYLRKDILQKCGKVKGYALIIVSIGVICYFIFATGSRASILSSVALLSVWTLYKLPIRHIRYKIALILLALALASIAIMHHPRMKSFNIQDWKSGENITYHDTDIRFNIWSTALESPKDYSLYGLGAGQSFNYLQKKYLEHGFNNYTNLNAHNQYIEEWIEEGLVGVLFFIMIWLSIPYFYSKRARKTAIFLCTIFMLNMLTDCMFGRFDGIALWCVWMVLIRLQSENHQEELPQHKQSPTNH